MRAAAAWAVALLIASASPPSGWAAARGKARRASTPQPSASVETVRPEEVAPEDRKARADGRGSLPPLGPAPAPPGEPSAKDELAELAEGLRNAWQSIPQYSPVNASSRLTSGFGWRPSPLNRRREFHGGIDLAAPRGTSVVAPADGIVERVFTDPGAGLVLLLAHGNGLQTLYGHLESVLVAEGERVARGAPLATVGSTGSRTTGPHLHYAVKLEGKYVNPRRYLFEPAAPLAVRKGRGKAG